MRLLQKMCCAARGKVELEKGKIEARIRTDAIAVKEAALKKVQAKLVRGPSTTGDDPRLQVSSPMRG